MTFKMPNKTIRLNKICACIAAILLLCTSHFTLYALPGSSQGQAQMDSASAVLDAVDEAGAWIADFNSKTVVQPPFGLTKTIGGADYQVAFTNFIFTPTGTLARTFARIILPQTDEDGDNIELLFSGYTNVSRTGGVAQSSSLAMIGTQTFTPNDQFAIIFTGYDPATGKGTKFNFDCDGFKSLDVYGTLTLSKDKFSPVNTKYEPFPDPTKDISAAVKGNIASWDDFIIKNLSFNRPFVLKNIGAYCFAIKSATLDLTDQGNPNGGDAFNDYLEKEVPDEPDTWTGLLINKMTITMPKEIRVAASNDQLSSEDDYALLDASGFTTTVKISDVLPIEKGKAKGWAFGIDEFTIAIEKSQFEGGGIAGELRLPIQRKGSNGVLYKGKISKNGDYEITAGLNNGINASLWKAHLELDNSSAVTIAVVDGIFKPKAVLNGKISFNTDGGKDEEEPDYDGKPAKKKVFEGDGITFEELTLQTQKPYLSIKSLSTAGNLNIASFSANYSIHLSADAPFGSKQEDGAVAALDFGVGLELMKGKIGGKTEFAVYGLYDTATSQWRYDHTQLNAVAVNADFGKASFKGDLTILKNDRIYGNGFAGSLSLTVSQFNIGAKGIFGVKDDYRYWSVDGSASGFRLPVGPIVFTGLTGGLTYQMGLGNADQAGSMPSGILYVPNKYEFLRARFGVLLEVVNDKMMKANAGMEMVWNPSWGVNSLTITGSAQMMSEGRAGGDQGGLLKKCLLKMTPAGDGGGTTETSSIWGDMRINFDFANSAYSANLNAFANFNNIVTGDQGAYKAGGASFYADKNNWWINVGTVSTPNQFRLQAGPLDLHGNGYFMMGNNMPVRGDAAFGVKHGMKFWLDVSGGCCGIVDGSVRGAIGYDMFIFKKNGFTCNNQPAGMNGWYGSAQLQATLNACVGVHKWGIGFNVLDASVSAKVEVRGPKPMWYKGTVDGGYCIGYGWFSYCGSYSLSGESGTYCPF